MSDTIISARREQRKKPTEGGSKHEEYDGSGNYADVLHVLYVFDMFQEEITKTPFVENNDFFDAVVTKRVAADFFILGGNLK